MVCSVSFPNGDFQAHEDTETKDVAKILSMDQADETIDARRPVANLLLPAGLFPVVMRKTAFTRNGFTARSV